MTVQMVIALAIVILMIAMMKAGSLGEIAYITLYCHCSSRPDKSV